MRGEEVYPRFKTKAWRSEAYLAYVRSRPCSVTGSNQDIIAHHVRCLGHGGMGLKPPDYLCLPLTAEEHTKLHQMGEAEYWAARGEDVASLIVMTMLIWLAKNPSPDLIGPLGDIISR